MLVQKYHNSHQKNKEILVSIQKAISASPQLRSKKQLIESFIHSVNNSKDVIDEWNSFVALKREEELEAIIASEKLKMDETRIFIEKAFADGEIRVTGVDIDQIMPPISRFGGGGNARANKKAIVLEKLKTFFEKYCGIGTSFKATNNPY